MLKQRKVLSSIELTNSIRVLALFMAIIYIHIFAASSCA